MTNESQLGFAKHSVSDRQMFASALAAVGLLVAASFSDGEVHRQGARRAAAMASPSRV